MARKATPPVGGANPDLILRNNHVPDNPARRFKRQSLPGGEISVGGQTRAMPHPDEPFLV